MSESTVINVTGDVVVNATGKPMAGKCRFCDFWEPDGYAMGDWRTCDALRLGERSNKSLRVLVLGWRASDWESKTSTQTHADFGCVLWKGGQP